MTENNEKVSGFQALGVPIGSQLTYIRDDSIICTTVDNKNHVEYEGKIYSLSGLAKELMKISANGYKTFKYNGVLLSKLGEVEKPVKSLEKTPTVAPKNAVVAKEVATLNKNTTQEMMHDIGEDLAEKAKTRTAEEEQADFDRVSFWPGDVPE